MHRRDFSASRNAGLVAAVSDLAFIIPAEPDASLAHDVSPRIRKRGFLITRRFESESSASSPKRSGGLSSRTCRRSCFVHDAATRANPSSDRFWHGFFRMLANDGDGMRCRKRMSLPSERIEPDPGRRIVISIPSTYDAGDNVALSAHVRGRRDKNVKNYCSARHL